MTYPADPYIAVQAALADDQQRELLERLGESNPRTGGIHVADYLAIDDDVDGLLELIEPIYERWGQGVHDRMLAFGIPEGEAGVLVRSAIRVRSLLGDCEVTEDGVNDLAAHAARIWKGATV